jgi:hypothetical protein
MVDALLTKPTRGLAAPDRAMIVSAMQGDSPDVQPP